METKENQEIIVGLDIGTTKIVAVVGRKTEHNKIEILGMGRSASVGVNRGVVTHIPQTTDSIREAVADASKHSGVDIKEVHVGIAGQHIRSIQQTGQLVRTETTDEISLSDIDKITDSMRTRVMNPGESIIDVIPQEFKVDDEANIKNPVGMSGRHLETNFHIIIGQIAAVNNIAKCVDKAGLQIASLVLEPIASSEAVLNHEEKEAGVVLVDIGGGTTDIAIFQDNIIRHTAVIALGGNIITDDIKEGCSVIRQYAEKLKIEHGSSLADENMSNEFISVPGIKGRSAKEISVKNLAHIIQARMEDIIELINAEIRNTGFEKKLIAGLVVTGGGAQLKHCSQLFEYITGMDTRIGYPNEHLAKTPVEEIASPMYSTSIGLVIKGIHHTEKLLRLGKSDLPPRKRGGLFGDWFTKFFNDEGIQ